MIIPHNKFKLYLNRKRRQGLEAFIEWRNYVRSYRYYREKTLKLVIRRWWSYNILIKEKQTQNIHLSFMSRMSGASNISRTSINSVNSYANQLDAINENDKIEENTQNTEVNNELSEYFSIWKLYIKIKIKNRLKAIDILHKVDTEIIQEKKKMKYIFKRMTLIFQVCY